MGILHQQKKPKQSWSDKSCQTRSDQGPSSTCFCLQQWQLDVSTLQRMERKAYRAAWQPLQYCTHLWCREILQTSFSKLQELPACCYPLQLSNDEHLEINPQTKNLHANFQKKKLSRNDFFNTFRQKVKSGNTSNTQKGIIKNATKYLHKVSKNVILLKNSYWILPSVQLTYLLHYISVTELHQWPKVFVSKIKILQKVSLMPHHLHCHHIHLLPSLLLNKITSIKG